MMEKQAVKHLVVDSGAFIKNAPVKDIGEQIHTVRDVVNEIRDKTTRDHLQVLPYELQFREPSQEALKIVSEFARKTGDLRVLSTTDLRLIALVYTLEKEFVGVDHIRTEPTKKVQYVIPGEGIHTEGGKPLLPGFYMRKTEAHEDHENEVRKDENESSLHPSTAADLNQEDIKCDDDNDGVDDDEGWIIPRKTVPMKRSANPVTPSHSENHKASAEDVDELSSEAGRLQVADIEDDGKSKCDAENEANDTDDDEDAKYDDEDDDEGWITPGNIDAMKQASLAINHVQISSLPVACLTTDYAMQNVLIQMGLHVVSVDGMLIRRTTTKILRCYGCFKVMSDCQRQFCSHCGNKTLSRVTVAYNDDGTIQYFFSKRKQFSTRGQRFSLPRPQGGKHAQNPVLCEDQRQSHKRPSKHSKNSVDVFDIDFVPNSSPFAPTDIYSRAALHGYTGRNFAGAGQHRRNPNENHKIYGHRK